MAKRNRTLVAFVELFQDFHSIVNQTRRTINLPCQEIKMQEPEAQAIVKQALEQSIQHFALD